MVNPKTKEVIAIQNVTYIDLESARDAVRALNVNRKNKGKEAWVLAIHSMINGYIKGKENFQNTFVK